MAQSLLANMRLTFPVLGDIPLYPWVDLFVKCPDDMLAVFGKSQDALGSHLAMEDAGKAEKAFKPLGRKKRSTRSKEHFQSGSSSCLFTILGKRRPTDMSQCLGLIFRD